MKITILTNRDLASHIALSRLIKMLSQHSLSIFISEKVGTAASLPQSLQQLAVFEKQVIAESPLSFEDLAAKAGCNLQGFADLNNQVNSPAGLQRVMATEPDLILSIRFGLIIRDPLIAIPRYGVINLHSGLLPEYRGVMATFRAMINGDTEIGSTLHFIQDTGIDTGDILSIAKIPLQKTSSYLLNVLNLYSAGCQQLVSAVESLERNISLHGQPQQGRPGYYSFPTDQDLSEFAAQGHQLFDPAELEAIRALQG
ncbi:MAG: formyl transferase [Porticoccaceae bacterium]|jgi:methionyl-tRNA formyltransferase|nr:formyl transferase [Porticoccaceae bacterium]MBT5577306.1 formyl transferase [Porticoccaceae bacterium]